jgi:peptidoglycan/LPS O-acetylase OafA/YrhL
VTDRTGRESRLPALTGVRFLAAAAVVCYHFAPSSLKTAALARGVITHGYMAVNFFFLLSGFVLAYNYADLQPSRQNRFRFWRARFSRIYPIYLLALLLAGGIVRIAARDFSLTHWLIGGGLSLACLQAWFPPAALSWNYPGWTIACEAFFYALFPFAISRLRRFPMGPALTGLWVLSLAAPVALAVAWSQGFHTGLTGWDTAYSIEELFVVCCPLFHLPTFLIGAFLGIRFLAKGPLSTAHSFIAIAGGTGIVLLVCMSSIPREFVNNGILTPAFSLVIYGLCSQHAISRALGGVVMEKLGDASYALYILQMPVFFGTRFLARNISIDSTGGSLAFFAFFLFVLVMVSIQIAKVADQLRAWLNGKIRLRPAPLVAVS